MTYKKTYEEINENSLGRSGSNRRRSDIVAKKATAKQPERCVTTGTLAYVLIRVFINFGHANRAFACRGYVERVRLMPASPLRLYRHRMPK